MNQSETSTGLKANSWEASRAFGDKVELEYCKEYLEKTFGHIMKSLEHIPYNAENMALQKDYGDYKLTLKPDKVYYIESKGRARDTTDLCVEVHNLCDGGQWRLRHFHTDKLFMWTPNNPPMLIDVPILRELIYQNDDWQKYVNINRKGDGACMYIPYNVVKTAYQKLLGLMLCG